MQSIEANGKGGMVSGLPIDFETSLQHAVGVIKESPLAPHVANLYLYGSCAKGLQQRGSDVDLLLVLDGDIDARECVSEIMRLKMAATPQDFLLPEVDLRVVPMDEWRHSNRKLYKNIAKDGIDLWEEAWIKPQQRRLEKINKKPKHKFLARILQKNVE